MHHDAKAMKTDKLHFTKTNRNQTKSILIVD